MYHLDLQNYTTLNKTVKEDLNLLDLLTRVSLGSTNIGSFQMNWATKLKNNTAMDHMRFQEKDLGVDSK